MLDQGRPRRTIVWSDRRVGHRADFRAKRWRPTLGGELVRNVEDGDGEPAQIARELCRRGWRPGEPVGG